MHAHHITSYTYIGHSIVVLFQEMEAKTLERTLLWLLGKLLESNQVVLNQPETCCWSGVDLDHKPQSWFACFFWERYFPKTKSKRRFCVTLSLRLCFDALWSLPPCQLPFEWFLGRSWVTNGPRTGPNWPNCIQGNAPVRFLVKFQSLGKIGYG